MSTQDRLLFRKGLLNDLKDLKKAPIIPGSINFTTDEPAIYLDFNDNGVDVRKRIGDLIIVKDYNELTTLTGNGDFNSTDLTDTSSILPSWSTTSLYYVESDNALLKWSNSDGAKKWFRLNPSHASLSSDLASLQNRVDGINDDYTTFKTSVYLKTDTYSKTEINAKIKTATDANDATQTEVDALKETVSNLTNATNTSISELQAKDTALETTISNGDASTLTTAKKYTDEKITAVNTTTNSLSQSINSLASSTDTKIAEAKSDVISTLTGKDTDNEFTSQTQKTMWGLKKYVDQVMADADAMTFKGVIGGTGNLEALPLAKDTKAGDTYKVGAKGVYAGYTCYIGDLLIAKDDGSSAYYHVTSGYEDDYNTRLTIDEAYSNAVVLESIAGVNHGSITFNSDLDETSGAGIKIEVTGTPTNANIAQAEVTVSMLWGSF